MFLNAILLSKKHVALIYAIRIFMEYSLESSKMAVVLVESRQQSTIPLPGRDVKTSNSSLKVGFQTKNRFSWKLVQRSILLGGGFLFTFNLCRHYNSRPCALCIIFCN